MDAPPPTGRSERNPIAIMLSGVVDRRGELTGETTVIVIGDRITGIAADPPAGARVIDLRPLVGVAGLIDVHTHLTYAADPAATEPLWEQLADRPVPVTLNLARDNAQRTVAAGVTTVRDLGAAGFADIALRDAIARGELTGPRMLVAGHGLERVDPRDTRPAAGLVAGPDDIVAAVQAQVAAGADVIKMFASTGSGEDVSGDPLFTFPEISAAVDAAHAHGRRIAVHSYGPAAARDAVRAGADSLEHATDLDDATLAEMARNGTVYVPTIDHNRYYAEHRHEYGYTERHAAELDAYRRRNLATAGRAIAAGVPIAMGSDAVFSMCGQNTRELQHFAEAGMTTAQALASATTTAAALLGRGHELGAIEAGYLADIVAVAGNPLDDLTAITERVRWVMIGGQVVIGPAGA